VADEPLNIDITAKDDASKVVDQLQGKVDKLEKSDPEVTVDADTGSADKDVDSFAKKLAKLGDADQVVVLALRAGAAQTELSQLATDIAQLDASDPDIDIKIDRYNEVAGELDNLETKMKDIADTSLDPDVGDKARQRLAGIGEEAGKTQGAVHSMAGNALGDLAATTSGIGPLGEAIGQLTETALEGEAGMKGLATAGLGLGALSAGMFVVNKVMGEFAKTAQRAAEIKAFNTADVDAFTKALTSGKNVVQDYVDRMTALGKGTAVAATRISDFAGPVLESTKDIAPALAAAVITMTQFAEAVTGSSDNLAKFDAAVKATGISVDDQNLIISGAQTEFDNLAKAHENATRFSKVFTDSTNDSKRAVDAFGSGLTDGKAATDKMASGLRTLAGRQDDVTSASDRTTESVRLQVDQIDTLKNHISDDQAWIDLQTDFDNVKRSGQEAWDAVKNGAEDASQKVRDHETDLNNLKLALIDYGTKVLGLPKDVVTDIVVNTNDAELDDTKRKLDDIRNHNKVVIDFVVNSPSGWYLLGTNTRATGPTASPGMAPAPTTNVTNFLAAPDARRQATQAQRTARVNGRR